MRGILGRGFDFVLAPFVGGGGDWFFDELVADAAHGEEVTRSGGIAFEVAAEADDEVIDGAGGGGGVEAPDAVEELIAGEDVAFV